MEWPCCFLRHHFNLISTDALRSILLYRADPMSARERGKGEKRTDYVPMKCVICGDSCSQGYGRFGVGMVGWRCQGDILARVLSGRVLRKHSVTISWEEK